MKKRDLELKADSGQTNTTCPECSSKRKKHYEKCLRVNLDDGVYFCQHCGASGVLEEYLRHDKQSSHNMAPKTHFVRPDHTVVVSYDTAVVSWMAERGIDESVLTRNKIFQTTTWMPTKDGGAKVGAVAFPYYRDGELINIKYRSRDKGFKMEKGCERILYGLDDLAETTIIVEGEMDKLACEMAGFKNCVSVPDGAPTANTRNYETKFDFLQDERLAGVEKWIIAVDNDAPGLRLREELIRRMGAEKCYVAEWPADCKDANDVLMKWGKDNLKAAIDSAKQVPVVGVFSASSFFDEVNDVYQHGIVGGVSTGWSDLDDHYTVMPGQLNVITGIPGHGKSEVMDALAVNLAFNEQWRVAFYSPENYPIKLHVVKLAEKYVGKPFYPGLTQRMSKDELTAASEWVNEMFRWIMPKHPTLDEVLDKARALVVRDGIRVLVIDPWNELESSRPEGMNEADYLSFALRKLRMFAREHQVALYVIAHPKVMVKDNNGTYPVPDPYSVSGGAMWRNKADNFLTVWRDMSSDSEPVQIHVQKIKFKICGKIGMVPVIYDRVTGRYQDSVITKAPHEIARLVKGVGHAETEKF